MIRLARASSDPEPPPPPQWDGPWNAYLYSLPFSLDNEEKADPDPTPGPDDDDGCFITFYDIAGYVSGSAQAPTGWVVTAQDTGFTPPGATVSDDPSIVNLTFEYSSGPDLVGPTPLATFSFDSVYPETAPGQFAAQDMNTSTSEFDTSQGTDLLPVVPEPAMAAGAVILCGALASTRRARGKFRS